MQPKGEPYYILKGEIMQCILVFLTVISFLNIFDNGESLLLKLGPYAPKLSLMFFKIINEALVYFIPNYHYTLGGIPCVLHVPL